MKYFLNLLRKIRNKIQLEGTITIRNQLFIKKDPKNRRKPTKRQKFLLKFNALKTRIIKKHKQPRITKNQRI